MATRHSALGRWAIRFLWGVALLSLCSDFIANERPLYCRIDGQSYYPVLRQYGVSLGLADWEGWMLQEPWQEREYERVVFAPIPYSAGTIDHRNTRFVGPLTSSASAPSGFGTGWAPIIWAVMWPPA